MWPLTLQPFVGIIAHPRKIIILAEMDFYLKDMRIYKPIKRIIIEPNQLSAQSTRARDVLWSDQRVYSDQPSSLLSTHAFVTERQSYINYQVRSAWTFRDKYLALMKFIPI